MRLRLTTQKKGALQSALRDCLRRRGAVYSQYSSASRYFILFGSVEIEFLPSERTKQSFAKKAQEHQAAYAASSAHHTGHTVHRLVSLCRQTPKPTE